jgi:hypothetical protein
MKCLWGNLNGRCHIGDRDEVAVEMNFRETGWEDDIKMDLAQYTVNWLPVVNTEMDFHK